MADASRIAVKNTQTLQEIKTNVASFGEREKGYEHTYDKDVYEVIPAGTWGKPIDPMINVTNNSHAISRLAYNFDNIPFHAPLIQTKLTVNSPGDVYEQEADAMADKIMRMTDNESFQMENFTPPVIQRKCDECEKEEQEIKVQRKSLSNSITPVQAGNEGSKGTGAVLSSRISALRGSGHAMDKTTQSFMSNRFGVDFSNVKIHADDDAAAMSRELNARAFTLGNDIYFSSGQYQPGSFIGKGLLAHELTHVVQQAPNLKTETPRPHNRTYNLPKYSHNFTHIPLHSKSLLPVQTKVDDNLTDLEDEEETDKRSDKIMGQPEDSSIEQTTGHPEENIQVQCKPLTTGVSSIVHAHGKPNTRASAFSSDKISASQENRNQMDKNTQSFMMSRFGVDFSSVKIHTDNDAVRMNQEIGAKAFTKGEDIYFNKGRYQPESEEGRHLLAHELTHVVQQTKKRNEDIPGSLCVSPVVPVTVQPAPLVTNVALSAPEVGVGSGRDITAAATVAGHPPLTWTINPGGAPPAGIGVIGAGRTVRIRAVHPAAGVVVGGVPFTVRAAMTATPGDFFDSGPIMPVQVVNATYTANPALAPVPSLVPGAPPGNTAEPNRDGINVNTAVVNVITAPVGRPVTITFRRALGAAIAANIITPGNRTGNIDIRISENATRARLNEGIPSTVNPPIPMAQLVVNAVPTRVSALARLAALGPYGQLNPITFGSSDTLHPPLTRIVGELITGVRDDFNLPPPNGAFNPFFLLALAVPANAWQDQLVTPAGSLNAADGRPAIDVNRFVGPGVPHLPRRLIYRQRFQYSSWQGGGAVISNTIADGRHIRSLIGAPGAFQFRTEHRFGAVSAPSPPEPYVGNPLIVLSNVRAVPTAVGATALAADGAATANISVVSNVPGRTVNWSVLAGDTAIAAGNPAVLPALATLRAGLTTGNFKIRAADSIFPNRRADGRVRVVHVQLRNMVAAPANVPAGTLTSIVSINARPGGRTLTWAVDAAAAAAGVALAPPSTGPGLAMNVTVTRPAGFRGKVIVRATDSVLAARTQTISIRFL